MEPMPKNNFKSRVLSTVDDEILCPICLEIFEEPVSCSVCEAHFCKKCISSWVAHSNFKCINRCEYVEKNSSPLLNRLLSKLTFECSYSKNGCTEIISYACLQKHDELCAFKEVACSGCKKFFLKTLLNEHKLTCPDVEVSCEDCSANIARKDFSQHDKDQCFKVHVKNSLLETDKRITLLENKIHELEEKNSALEKIIGISKLQKDSTCSSVSEDFVQQNHPFGEKTSVSQAELQAWYDSFPKANQSINTNNPAEKYPGLLVSGKGYYIWLGEKNWYYGKDSWDKMICFSRVKGDFNCRIISIARGIK